MGFVLVLVLFPVVVVIVVVVVVVVIAAVVVVVIAKSCDLETKISGFDLDLRHKSWFETKTKTKTKPDSDLIFIISRSPFWMCTTVLKVAKVLFLFKNGERSYSSNYRPIALLSIFDK